MATKCYLVREEHVPAKAAFPAVDAHNHLWGNRNLTEILHVMDEVGVACYADLTANARIAWVKGGYALQQGDFGGFLVDCVQRHPGRFYGFTMATFARPPGEPLFSEARRFVEETVDLLRRHVQMGARGLKITKELGLHFRDDQGRVVFCDDDRLADIWEEAGRLGVPVLIHQSDPFGFHEPATPDNEHYDSLAKYPSWSFADPGFPRKAELIRRRDRLVRSHPRTAFILPHVANYPEHLAYVGRLLDENPNVYVDLSARMDELGRQPYTTREFFLRYQDRILFGSDMPASTRMYRCYFRFLETFDEYFFPPDYDGTFDRRRWAIYGIGLPQDVLANIYYRNALKIVPGLEADLAGAGIED